MSRAIAVTVALSVLTACGSDPEPRFEADPTPSPTLSTSPTPDDPEPWEEKSDEGAIAFVEHWLREFNYAENTGETAELRDVSSADCESCQNFIDEIERVYSAGGKMRSDGWKVVVAGRPESMNRDLLAVPLEVKQSDQRVREAADAPWVTNEGIRLGLSAQLAWDGEWQMKRLDIVS